jgi:hypothetical protein
MDETLVFAKTPKGMAEVTQRAGGLSLQARRVLIMIDGDRSIGELAPLLREGEIDEVIELLQLRGLIRPIGQGEPDESDPITHGDSIAGPSTSADPAPPTGQDAPAAERIYLPIDEVKRRAVRELNERLGPEAASIAMRIERSANAEELRERLREAERLIARTIGETSAHEFIRAMRRR